MPAYHPQRIEPKWQADWERNKTFRAVDLDPGRPKLYILDMFPYPSGAGLHVGHPEGYTATDILCRYKRMRGFNVLHPMGWDAFGLPAEQYAVQTDTHPRITTQDEHRHLPPPDQVARLLLRLGPRGRHDRPRLLQVDPVDLPADSTTPGTTPISSGPTARASTARARAGRSPSCRSRAGTADPDAYRDSQRLAYRAEVPVNWCPELGTVLANEEVIDGKSERGGHPGRPDAADASGCCGSPPTPSG